MKKYTQQNFFACLILKKIIWKLNILMRFVLIIYIKLFKTFMNYL